LSQQGLLVEEYYSQRWSIEVFFKNCSIGIPLGQTVSELWERTDE